MTKLCTNCENKCEKYFLLKIFEIYSILIILYEIKNIKQKSIKLSTDSNLLMLFFHLRIDYIT